MWTIPRILDKSALCQPSSSLTCGLLLPDCRHAAVHLFSWAATGATRILCLLILLTILRVVSLIWNRGGGVAMVTARERDGLPGQGASSASSWIRRERERESKYIQHQDETIVCLQEKEPWNHMRACLLTRKENAMLIRTATLSFDILCFLEQQP